MQVSSKSLRLLTASLIAVPLALLSGAHALSSVSIRRAPELAKTIYPWNGAAVERVAYSKFVGDVRKELDVGRDGSSKRPEIKGSVQASPDLDVRLQRLSSGASASVIGALALEPVLPRAYVLLALSETNLQRRREIITLARRMTRRDSALQGLALQQKRDDQQFAGAISILDQILRVHPEREDELFPLLADAIRLPDTRPAFVRLLRKPLPWRDAFLVFSLGEKRTLGNLAYIRERITLDNLEFDQRLIAGLAKEGDMQAAEKIYRRVAASSKGRSAGDSAGWVSVYPPFDWKLVDTKAMRAQPDFSQDGLEFYVEPGNGGALASRVIERPDGRLSIAFDLEMQPIDKISDVKLQMTCWGQATPFFEKPLSLMKNIVRIDEFPSCPFVELAIITRAWTGGRALTGTLTPLKITTIR